MVHRNSSSTVCVAPTTVAIGLMPQKGSKRSKVTGEQLYSRFKRANAACTWNPALIQAVKRMKLTGFLLSNTLLLHGTSDHVEVLKGAWMKNTLLAPDNYKIIHFGELPALCLETVTSAYITPLPDALCIVIQQLNRINHLANVPNISKSLQALYQHVELPSDQVIHGALNDLIRERKICLTDMGYLISKMNRPQPMRLPHQSQSYDTDSQFDTTAVEKTTRKRSFTKVTEPDKCSQASLKSSHNSIDSASKLKSKDATKAKSRSIKRFLSGKLRLRNKNTSPVGDTATNSVSNTGSSGSVDNDGSLDAAGGSAGNGGGPGAGSSSGIDPVAGSNMPFCSGPYGRYGQLTQSRVEGQRSCECYTCRTLPPMSVNVINDSLQAHCGATMIECDTPDRVSAPAEEPAPQNYHRTLKSHRTKATTQLLSEPSQKEEVQHTSSAHTSIESRLPTESYYKNSQQMVQESIDNEIGDSDQGFFSPIRINSSNSWLSAQAEADKENDRIVYRSTPQGTAPAEARQVFNATGHTNCDACSDIEILERTQRNSYYDKSCGSIRTLTNCSNAVVSGSIDRNVLHTERLVRV